MSGKPSDDANRPSSGNLPGQAQGERIGKLENQFSKLIGMGTILSVIFTLFSGVVFTIFFNANTSVIGIGKDIEVLKTYLKEDRVLLDVQRASLSEANIKILKLEGRLEYMDKVLRDIDNNKK